MNKIESFFDQIANIICGMNVIHISHNDMDGYGCAVIERMFDPIYQICTGKMVPQFYQNMQTVNAISDNYYERSENVHLLITDIGSISIEDILDNIDVDYTSISDVVILDHHQIDDEQMDGFELVEEHDPFIGDYNRNPYVNTLRIYYARREGIDFYYVHTTAVSATELLRYMAMNGIQSDIFFYTNFAYNVSKYDTGKWGNWAVSDGNIDMDIRIKYAWDKVLSDNKALNDVMSYPRLKDIMDQWVMMCTALLERTEFYIDDKYNPVMEYPEKIDDIELEYYTDLERKYNEFVDSLRIENVTGVSHNLFVPTSIVNSTIRVKQLNAPVNKIATYIDDPDEKLKEFSMFSRKFLEDHQEIDVMFNVNPPIFKGKKCKTAVVQIRSSKDIVDCSIIARANGGGGHPRAAGFKAFPNFGD